MLYWINWVLIFHSYLVYYENKYNILIVEADEHKQLEHAYKPMDGKRKGYRGYIAFQRPSFLASALLWTVSLSKSL